MCPSIHSSMTRVLEELKHGIVKLLATMQNLCSNQPLIKGMNTVKMFCLFLKSLLNVCKP